MNTDKQSMFEESLRETINRYSMENGSDTPDYILAQYLSRCLDNYNKAVTSREQSKQPPIGSKDYEILSFVVKNVEGFNGQILQKIDGYFGVKDFYVTEEDLLNSKIHTIHSVRRISDGEVFTVGEKVLSLHKDEFVIAGFKIGAENKMMILSDPDYAKSNLEYIQKIPTPSPKEEGKIKINGHTVHYELGDNGVPNIISIAGYIFYPALNAQKTYTQSEVDAMMEKVWNAAREIDVTQYKGVDILKKLVYQTFEDYRKSTTNPAPPIQEEKKDVLFTTEDGVDIKEGDDIVLHHVSPNFDLSWSGSRFLAKQNRDYFKIFSTKEAAEQYILENKPCLSLNDLLEVWDGYKSYNNGHFKGSKMYERFEQKAKQKINPWPHSIP